MRLGCGAFLAGMNGKADIYCYTFSDNQKILRLKHRCEHMHAHLGLKR